MTLRRFNYTGRRKISGLRIHISQSEYKVLDLQIPDEALVQFAPEDCLWLEARRAGALDCLRFSLGTVGNRASAAGLNFSSLGCSAPAFVFKVVSGREAGGLLAGLSSDITVELGAVPGGRSLLPVNVEDQLQARAWELVFGSLGPVLNVSSRIPKAQDFAASPVFTVLVLPEVLRQILLRIMVEEKHFDIEAPDAWQAKWLRFACGLHEDHTLPDEPEGDDAEGLKMVTDWIDEVIAGFEGKTTLLGRYVSELREAAE